MIYYDKDVEFIGISGMGLENREMELDCPQEEMQRPRQLWQRIQEEKVI